MSAPYTGPERRVGDRRVNARRVVRFYWAGFDEGWQRNRRQAERRKGDK